MYGETWVSFDGEEGKPVGKRGFLETKQLRFISADKCCPSDGNGNKKKINAIEFGKNKSIHVNKKEFQKKENYIIHQRTSYSKMENTDDQNLWLRREADETSLFFLMSAAARVHQACCDK